VLGDAEKRKKYDNLGDNWQNQQQGYDFNSARQGGRGRQQGGSQYFSGAESEFSDFFESIFGRGATGFSSAGGPRGARQMKGNDYQAEATITLEEAFHGTSRQLNLSNQTLNLKLKPGISDGQILRMKEKGGPGANGGPNGDLFITIHVQKHPIYERKGDDLYFDQPLDVFTAMLGGKLSVQAIDKALKINIPTGTDSDKTFRLKEMGMPEYSNPKQRGDSYVRVLITVPKNLSDSDKETLAEIAKKVND